MPTFNIEIQESYAKELEIQANSVKEAVAKVFEKYQNGEIVLDSKDFVETKFVNLNLKQIGTEKNALIREVVDYMFKDEQRHFGEFGVKPKNHIFLKLKRLKEYQILRLPKHKVGFWSGPARNAQTSSNFSRY